MFKQVNIALQIVPSSKSKHPYDIVDKAIEVIRLSGIKYKVCPFETVMESEYDKIMEIIRKVHTSCLEYGADSFLSYIKIQVDKNADVLIEDKTGKYR